ncbi:MAG: hypothetical protein U0939_00925 [Pirellulales bacterium]
MSRSALRSASHRLSPRRSHGPGRSAGVLSPRWASVALPWLAVASLAIGLSVSGIVGAAAVHAAQPEEADAARQRANAARIAAQERCKSDPALHGAWVANLRPDPADDKKWLVDILVESDAAADQRQALESLLKSDVAIAGEIRIPVRKLVAQLQKRLEERFKKRGTFIAGAYVSETDTGVLQLSLFGRVPAVGEQDVAESECVTLMEADPAWYDGEPTKKRLLPESRTLLGPAWDEDTEAAANKVYERLKNDADARGIWLELSECRDHLGKFSHYDVSTWVDPTRADAQRKTIAELLKLLEPRTSQIVQETAAPLSQLLETFNLHLSSHSRFDGCYIDDAHFERQKNSLVGAVLVLRGRVTRESLNDAIQGQVCEPWLQQDPTWNVPAGQVVFGRPEFRVVEPITWRAAEFFEYGYSLYRQHDYAGAADAFGRAVIDAPRTSEYRYWQILALQQAGESDRAYGHMLALVNRQPLPVTNAAVVRSLERIQGHARQELLRLRRKAESQYYLDKRMQRDSAPPEQGRRA